MAAPEVSVVVICYNDAAHLARAVDSVLRQSLRRIEVIIVDDCSTDETPAVARTLTADDDRVRYQRLPENSGGCGAPRNAGIAVARARYVMFLDSDDELEQHACYNLWLTAERENCDVVSGKCRRFHTDTERWTTWYPFLYAKRLVLTDLDELPTFVYDSISTNMLYRKAFLDKHELRFPVGVKYEDLTFTAQVYALVTRFAIIPETVYHWYIYTGETRRTITNDRSRPDNLGDRLRAIHACRDTFATHGKEAMLATLTDKFLHHDARIAVDDAVETDDDELRGAILETLDPHLRDIPHSAYSRLTAMNRAAFAMALLRDREGMAQARMSTRNRGAQAGRLVRRDGRVLWAPLRPGELPEPGSLEEFLCDLTGDRVLDTPARSLRLAHVISGGQPLNPGVELIGITHDTFTKFTRGDASPELVLSIRRRHGRGTQTVPVTVTESSPGVIRWSARVPGFDDRDTRVDGRWWLSLRVSAAGRVNDSELCVAPGTEVVVPEPAGVLARLGSQVELYRTRLGDAALRRVRLQGPAAKPALVLHKIERAASIAEAQTHKQRGNMRVRYYRARRRLPLYPDTVLFDSHMGKQFSDNPRAVYEELRRRDTGLNLVWDFSDPAAHVGVGCRTIKRHTPTYSDLVARAAAIVDNQGLPAWVTKREDQFHLQTWHGTPLKRMALHKLENIYATPETRDRIIGEAAWDALVSPSEYFERTFVDSYRYTGELIRGGSPRNDVLINNPEPDPEFVAQLDLPRDRRIVLYAPTFREHLRHSRSAAEIMLDLDRWVEQYGDTHFLLIRAHYLNRFAIGREHLPYVMDVSWVEQISDLYRVADLLLTDYSSAMFDYSWLDRPIVIYAPDYDEYVHDTRGAYFELRTDNPGLFGESQDELPDLFQAAEQPEQWRAQLQAFRAKYCGIEDGKASVRAVERLLAALGR